ncbi:hypothetical protein KL86DYS1_30651 [uncultured Dysgonomonas sp.]|uniref:Uncharacterized protein n=1 Tax=uncultured Dysgonomonas sp. TaxID=206096 RepID=A0A212JWJ3_9BACT|nr:hypothetical protein KL86DYS1_30651 [uncultured Dysgonomonas sp.]
MFNLFIYKYIKKCDYCVLILREYIIVYILYYLQISVEPFCCYNML